MSLLCIVVIGSVFGYIFIKTKSLYLSIGLHFAWDFFSSLFGVGKSMFNTNFILVFESSKTSDFFANLIIVITFIILFFVVVFKYKMDESKGNYNLINKS
ncbi:MAG: CPBP family glutamic-type intramembrane protease [Clostridium sp.]|uniref:CPBP family glutamic-type intramembrane protease n=1 Tax=Clostridium sp. TaxID=1506 RepID=UPI003D6D0ED1